MSSWTYGASLGLISWSTELDLDTVIPEFDIRETDKIVDDSGVALYGGVSAIYAMNENVDLTFGVTWFVYDLSGDVIDGETLDMQNTLISASATYRF